MVQGQIVGDDDGQLRAELARIRGQVTRLEDAANRPIDAIAENYERIGRQYGPPATGKTGIRQ
jgi:hypothetical protein